MNFFLKVAAAYQAVRFTMELCREAKQLKAQARPVEPTPPSENSGHLVMPEKENTLDVNKIGVSSSAGSIPGYDDPGFIPEAVEGDSLGKSTGRIGVDKDCSAGSPIVEQQHSKKKPRARKKRARIRQAIPRFTIVEPTLVSVEIR
jgi:hypothetical protein